MEIDLNQMEKRDSYRLLSSCIVPRPIAWVSTRSAAGVNNLAPFSYFNGVASDPPSLSISVSYHSRRDTGQKDTLQNILETREFVVNIVTEETAVAMQKTSFDHAPEVDEFEAAGLDAVPSLTVRPPRVAQSPVCFECTVHTTLQVGEGPGSSTLVVGVIHHVYVRDGLINEQGMIDTPQLLPLGRLAGTGYCVVSDVFEIPSS